MNAYIQQVENVVELENKTHVYSIYCDDTPTNYMIIGFLESGKSEPSVVMQIAKFDIINWGKMKEK